MKKFPGQAKDDKILFFSREYLLSFLISNFWTIIGALIIFLVFSVILYYLGFYKIILLIFIVLLIYYLYFFVIYKDTYFIITNKRLLKFVRTGFFSEHLKELKLDQINELTFERNGFWKKIFNFGNIKIVGKDKEAVMWVRGIKYPDEVVQYISRLKDFLKENPDVDVNIILPFIPRKIRKGKK